MVEHLGEHLLAYHLLCNQFAISLCAYPFTEALVHCFGTVRLCLFVNLQNVSIIHNFGA